MAKVRIELPTVLSQVVGGARVLEANGETLQAVFADAFSQCPALEVHLVDEAGVLREHVLCFLNDENTRWAESFDRPVSDGDRITILQAVSGG
ncbi:MAG: MoaD/ThiS family protein [Planctomycetota bacterium]